MLTQHPDSNYCQNYVDFPKANGYRSVHTTVLHPGGLNMELQVKKIRKHNPRKTSRYYLASSRYNLFMVHLHDKHPYAEICLEDKQLVDPTKHLGNTWTISPLLSCWITSLQRRTFVH